MRIVRLFYSLLTFSFTYLISLNFNVKNKNCYHAFVIRQDHYPMLPNSILGFQNMKLQKFNKVISIPTKTRRKSRRVFVGTEMTLLYFKF